MSSSEAIPVKLPVPPSTPSLPQKDHNDLSVIDHAVKSDSVAARALAALDDEDVPSSLDVHIRWVVESGSIVQKGEKIAQLFYCFHGSPPPPLSASASGKSSSTIIRARTKKKRWGSVSNPSAETSNNTTQTSDDALPKENNNSVSLEMRSPSNGFLRVLYKKSFAFNAVQIGQGGSLEHSSVVIDLTTSSPKYSVINLILAAIEPCEHPAVVGGLCAVCGADTRTQKNNSVEVEDHKPQKYKRPSVVHHNNNMGAKKPVDTKQQQIIEKQKKLAAAVASSKEFDNANDEELAYFDMDAAISYNAPSTSTNASNPKPSLSNIATKPAPAPKVAKPTAPPTAMRSLSSLLSGAKATQQMQKIPPRQKQQPQQTRPAASRQRPRLMAMSRSTSSYPNTTADPNMSKMTVSGGVTITISESEAKNISEGQSKKLREEKKLCLVLDLDHTLLHATDDYRAGRFVAEEVYTEKYDNSDEKKEGDNKDTKAATKTNPGKREDVRSILLPVELPPAQQEQYVQQKLQQQKQEETHFCLSPLPQQKQGAHSSIIMRHYVKLRPHLKEFFAQIMSTYQLSVYTAGTRSYAEQIAVMICRHLVGATLDEEGLNSLRSKVREKNDACRKYREYKGRVGRKKQLELALEIERDDIKTGIGKVKKRSVSFTKEAVDRKTENTSVDESEKSLRAKKPPSNHADGATKSAKINKAAAAKADKESEKYLETSEPPSTHTSGTTTPVNNNEASAAKADNAANDGECSSSSSSQKRALEDGKQSTIPRKKKRVTSGSLLTPALTEAALAKQSKEKNPPVAEEEHMDDPSEERDRLRKELEEAEKLEIAAVELRRKIFGSRIVSRTDVGDLGKDVKSLKRVFPCGGVMAAILDDREDVWANAKNNVTGRPGEPPDNLLLVKPYHWKPFIGYADVNNASGQDLSNSDDAQRPPLNGKEDDMQLLWTADILRRLHERYYSTSLSQEEREGVTVPSLLQSMRRETFLRHPQVKVVFSGLIPISRQNQQAQIRPNVVRYAEELGAEVLPGVSNELTHVVAARDGSEKIRQARKEVPGCFIVHTSWLMESYWSINRRDVRPHHIGPMPSQHAKQLAMGNKRDTRPRDGGRSKDKAVLLLDGDEEESDKDESEDDFADDLEKEMMMEGKR